MGRRQPHDEDVARLAVTTRFCPGLRGVGAVPYLSILEERCES